MEEIRTGYGHQRDPARRWLRHTYQEGPGFRFLATRGGRPPLAAEPRVQMAQVRARASIWARDDSGTPP